MYKKLIITSCLITGVLPTTTVKAVDTYLMDQVSMQVAIQSYWFTQPLGRVTINKAGTRACVEEITSTDPNAPRSAFFDVKKDTPAAPLIVTIRNNPC